VWPVTLYTSVRKVLGWDLGWDAGQPGGFHGFLSSSEQIPR
jgi:hypothetical protein